MMELFVFRHDQPMKAGCCNWRVSATYWLANSREAARQEIRVETPDDREPHGLCANCMADLLTSDEYEITRVEA